MTKQEAIAKMRELSRNVVTIEIAREIAAAFGTTTQSLGVMTARVRDTLAVYHPSDARKLCVDVSHLAYTMAWKLRGVKVESQMLGRGSSAEDVTEKACKVLEV